jgi:hypothetical protein
MYMCIYCVISKVDTQAPRIIHSHQIDLSLKVYKPNFNVYGTVALAVNVTVSNGAAHLRDNKLVVALGGNQPLDNFTKDQLLLALALQAMTSEEHGTRCFRTQPT